MDVHNNFFIVNGPGVYLRKNMFDNNDVVMVIMMDTVQTLASSQPYGNILDVDPNMSTPNNMLQISNIPIMKWIHVAVRVEGTNMDAYVNGIVAGRLVFDSVPNQNFYDINCCCNNGFNGSMSNLQYFNYALTSFDINSIVYRGPNLTQANNVGDTTSFGQPYYLNNSWFYNKMQVD